MPTVSPKITPFLWFDTQAEEAAQFYTSIFPNSKIEKVVRYGEAGPGPKDSVMTVAFQVEGQPFSAINGGPIFKFTEAISFVVHCENQAEVDRYWDKLSEGGAQKQCGWLKDKFGLSWQIVPEGMVKMFKEGNPEGTKRMTKAMMQMKKLDIAALEAAYRGE